MGEVELEEIVKIGQAGENARALLSSDSEATQASGRLLGDYEGLDRAKTARTPRTAPQGEITIRYINLSTVPGELTLIWCNS